MAVVLAVSLLTIASASVEMTGNRFTKHFVIRYVANDDVRAEYVGDRSEEWFDKLSVYLGKPEDTWSRVPILVYPTHHAFAGGTGEKFGERLVGMAYSGNLRIELDASEQYSPMERILGHELTHIFIFRILGSRVSDLPLWANEGIAKMEAEEWDELDNASLSEAAASNGLPHLSDLRSSFPKGEKTLAYAVSSSVIRYMSAHSRHDAIRHILDSVSAGSSFTSAVSSVTGRTMDDWESDWRKQVNSKYAPFGWVRMLGLVTTAVLPVLAIAAYLALRRKKQRYIEQYDWDDGYSPEIDKEYWPDR